MRNFCRRRRRCRLVENGAQMNAISNGFIINRFLPHFWCIQGMGVGGGYDVDDVLFNHVSMNAKMVQDRVDALSHTMTFLSVCIWLVDF